MGWNPKPKTLKFCSERTDGGKILVQNPGANHEESGYQKESGVVCVSRGVGGSLDIRRSCPGASSWHQEEAHEEAQEQCNEMLCLAAEQ